MAQRTRLDRERTFYLLLSLAISASVFTGFWFTYIGPVQLMAPRSSLSVAVHVHGISFLLWYALLVLQAWLVRFGAIRLHRWLGYANLLWAALMIAAGLLVIAVRMDSGLRGEDMFWADFGLIVLSNLILFSGFYTGAFIYRDIAPLHRRLIIAAAVTGSGAAMFRTFAAIFGFTDWGVPVAILTTNAFIVAAMAGDRILLGRVHRIYWIILPVAMVTELVFYGLTFTEAGRRMQQALVDWLRFAFPLYG